MDEANHGRREDQGSPAWTSTIFIDKYHLLILSQIEVTFYNYTSDNFIHFMNLRLHIYTYIFWAVC